MDIDEYKERVSSVAAKTLTAIEQLVDQGGLDMNESYKASNAICSLARGVSEINRGARTRSIMLAKVRKEFIAMLQKSLSARPDLVEELQDLADNSTFRLLELTGENTDDNN